MHPADSGNSINTQKLCTRCCKNIKAGEEHNHYYKVLCEDCYLDVRMVVTRKTDWQYLGSIKTEYLIPSKKT